MFQQGCCPQSSEKLLSSLQQFKTLRSQRTAASQDRYTSSFFQQAYSVNPSTSTDKDLIIEKLQRRISQLQQDVLAEHKQRRDELDLIKKQVGIMEKEMEFFGKENSCLEKRVKQLRDENIELARAIGHQSELLKVISEYHPKMVDCKKQDIRIKRSKSKSNLKRKLSIDKRGSSRQVLFLKKEIKTLDNKIRKSHEKLVEVRKRVI